MTTFDNKEKAEENKYAHDKEVEFKIKAKFHKLLGTWVAEKLGFDVEKTEAYKNKLITGGLGNQDPQALYAEISHEFIVHNLHMPENELRQKLHDLLQDARHHVMEK